MVTRIYFPSSGTTDITPAFDSSWENTGDGDRIKCYTTKQSTSMTDKSHSAIDSGDTIIRQYISSSIIAQNISGNLKGQIMCMCNGAGYSYSAIVARIVSNDGITFRGTLCTAYSDSVIDSNFVNRMFKNDAITPISLTNVTAQNGDKIVIEIGIQPNLAFGLISTFKLGDNGSLDLPEDETDTDITKNSWIEFDSTIGFQEETTLMFMT